MQLWQHKENPDVKFLAKVKNNEEVKIVIPRLSPGADYHPPHLWANGGTFPRDEFMKLYEPVRLDDTDEKTLAFWKEWGPSQSTRSS